jgi:CheY-like chemotaxis protein
VSGRQRVLLLVDDEERILSALRRSLRREGWTLLTAESAEEALALLEARPVDLILSDSRMPGLGGLELFERARRLRPEAARVMLTGWPESIPQARLEALGVFALLAKPWDDAELKQTLRRALDA